MRPAAHADAIHGVGGLAGTDLLPEPKVLEVMGVEAVDAMAKALLTEEKGTSWLVATGTLTNVAVLIEKYPEVVPHIKGLGIMGGAVGGGFTSAPMGKVGEVERFGNWTPYGEFNVVADPEAAARVFDNAELASKTTLIPLDVSHQVFATEKVQRLLRYGKEGKAENETTLRTMLIELLGFFAETYDTVFGLKEGPPLHDPIALAAIFEDTPYAIGMYDYKNGEEGRRERFKVKVIIEGTHEQAMTGETQTGRTVVELLPKGEEGVKIPRSLNVERFWTVLEDALEAADANNALDAKTKVPGRNSVNDVNGNGVAH